MSCSLGSPSDPLSISWLDSPPVATRSQMGRVSSPWSSTGSKGDYVREVPWLGYWGMVANPEALLSHEPHRHRIKSCPKLMLKADSIWPPMVAP